VRQTQEIIGNVGAGKTDGWINCGIIRLDQLSDPFVEDSALDMQLTDIDGLQMFSLRLLIVKTFLETQIAPEMARLDGKRL